MSESPAVAAATAPACLLDAFPLLRARSAAAASEAIGRVFSPHRLELDDQSAALNVQHNQIRLRELSLNVLTYGSGVRIDPGERGDFYMVQIPLAGRAHLSCGRDEVAVDNQTLSVLQPRARSRMHWSSDCTMILLQVPRTVVDRRAAEWGLGPKPRFALARPRHEPAVGAWWQAVLDLTTNLDRYGQQWLQHPAAYAAMEEFLLSGFTSMLREPTDGAPRPGDRGDARCVRRAKEFIEAHLRQSLTLGEIAAHACVSPRALEAAFKRDGEPPPLVYARQRRLHAVRQALLAGARHGGTASVTEVALDHGFLHMGRFAAQYRALFGCAPSDTLRLH